MPQSHRSAPTLPADIRLDEEGGHCLLTPITEAGHAWAALHLAPGTPWRGGSAEVPAGDVNALVNRMTEAGLAVAGPM
jgi:hypothetical protein